jgi:hypothetical protein
MNAISETEALDLARSIAATNQWQWLPPVSVKCKRRFFRTPLWVIHSNSEQKGCNVHIELDSISGEIVKAAFWPR